MFIIIIITLSVILIFCRACVCKVRLGLTLDVSALSVLFYIAYSITRTTCKGSCWFFLRMCRKRPAKHVCHVPGLTFCERNRPHCYTTWKRLCGLVSFRSLVSRRRLREWWMPSGIQHDRVHPLCTISLYWSCNLILEDVRVRIRVGLWSVWQLHAHDHDSLFCLFRTSAIIFWLFNDHLQRCSDCLTTICNNVLSV